MTSKRTPSTAQRTASPQSKPLTRAVKVAAAAFAVLYVINGTAVAAGYVKALRAGDESSIAQTVWVGAAWPVVIHDMMRAGPLERVGNWFDRDT